MDSGRDIEDLDERELNELGNAYSAHGMWEEAIDSYLRSLAMRKSRGDDHGRAIVLNNLGGVYYVQGRLPEAKDCFETSRQIAGENGEGLTELVGLMNLAFLHFTEGQSDDFLRRADEAEVLAQELEQWEPLSKLSWLRGRLALAAPDRYEKGLTLYAEALEYAARVGETQLAQMLDRVDGQAEQLMLDGSRGLALVLYDYLQLFAQDQGFDENTVSRLSTKREEILWRPSLA